MHPCKKSLTQLQVRKGFTEEESLELRLTHVGGGRSRYRKLYGRLGLSEYHMFGTIIIQVQYCWSVNCEEDVLT